MAVTSTVTGSFDTGQATDRGLKSVQYGGLIKEDVMNRINAGPSAE